MLLQTEDVTLTLIIFYCYCFIDLMYIIFILLLDIEVKNITKFIFKDSDNRVLHIELDIYSYNVITNRPCYINYSN